MSRPNRWKSDSQANAEALDRRERTYSEASGRSFRVSWDWHNREPRDLREAVRMVRAAYADEVPARIHNRDLADDGTPKMTPQAEGYIFGSDTVGEERRAKCVGEATCRTHQPHKSDCPVPMDIAQAVHGYPWLTQGGRTFDCACRWVHHTSCPEASGPPALDFYRTPFRAALATLERHSPKRAAVVSHIAIGSQGPMEAAQAEGVPSWCARIVADDVLRAFLRNLTDIKVHLPRETEAA